jgi:hypothetical protein
MVCCVGPIDPTPMPGKLCLVAFGLVVRVLELGKCYIDYGCIGKFYFAHPALLLFLNGVSARCVETPFQRRGEVMVYFFISGCTCIGGGGGGAAAVVVVVVEEGGK